MVASYRKQGHKESEIASLISNAALKRVAESMNISVEELTNVPAGKARRQRHDDITVVVIFFEEER